MDEEEVWVQHYNGIFEISSQTGEIAVAPTERLKSLNVEELKDSCDDFQPFNHLPQIKLSLRYLNVV
jgi:hypothetical protein